MQTGTIFVEKPISDWGQFTSLWTQCGLQISNFYIHTYMEVSEIGGKETFRKANLSKETNLIIKCTNIHFNENWNN